MDGNTSTQRSSEQLKFMNSAGAPMEKDIKAWLGQAFFCWRSLWPITIGTWFSCSLPCRSPMERRSSAKERSFDRSFAFIMTSSDRDNKTKVRRCTESSIRIGSLNPQTLISAMSFKMSSYLIAFSAYLPRKKGSDTKLENSGQETQADLGAEVLKNNLYIILRIPSS